MLQQYITLYIYLQLRTLYYCSRNTEYPIAINTIQTRRMLHYLHIKGYFAIETQV
jgi:hypothetical protein